MVEYTSFGTMMAGNSMLATLVASDWMKEGVPFLNLVAEVKSMLVSVDERVTRGARGVDVSDFSSDLGAMVRAHAHYAHQHLRILEALESGPVDLPLLALIYTAIERQKLALDLSGW